MALTIDCGEGRHDMCSGTISGSSYLFPQTADYPDRPCACRCHAGLGSTNKEPGNDEIAEMRRGEAALAEGFCPWDGARLGTLTETETEAAVTWAHPPLGWCPQCRCYVGAYVSNGGGYFGTHDLGLAVAR